MKIVTRVFLRSAFRYSRQFTRPPQNQLFTDLRSIKVEEIAAKVVFSDGTSEIRRFKVEEDTESSIQGLQKFLSELDLNAEIVVHDLKRELHVFWRLGLEPKFNRVFDTMITLTCLWMGQQKSGDSFSKRDFEDDPVGLVKRQNLEIAKWQERLSLGTCAAAGTPRPSHDPQKNHFNKSTFRFGSFDNTKLGRELSKLESLYGDVSVKAHNQGLTTLLTTVEFPFAEALARIEWNGLAVDSQRQLQLANESRIAIKKIRHSLLDLGIDKPSSHERFERFLVSNSLIGHFTERTEQGKISQRLKVLMAKVNLHPAIKLVYQFRRFSRIFRLWGIPFTLSRDLGRLHPEIIQNATVTGRCSTRRPVLSNMQTIVRSFIIPGEGNSILEFDFSSFELIVVAAYFGEDILLDLYTNFDDVYMEIASRFFPELEQNLTTRGLIKECMLGLINGITASGLSLLLEITETEAQLKLETLKCAFPKLANGLEEYIVLAKGMGYAPMVGGLRREVNFSGMPSGRLRKVLLNTPSQGNAAEVFKAAVVKVDQHYLGTGLKIILLKHDSIVVECSSELLDDVKRDIKDLMENAGKVFFKNLKLKVTIHDREPEHWGKLKDFTDYLKELQEA